MTRPSMLASTENARRSVGEDLIAIDRQTLALSGRASEVAWGLHWDLLPCFLVSLLQRGIRRQYC